MHQNNHKDLILMDLLKILLDFIDFMWIVTFWFTIYDVPFFVANFEYSFSVLLNKFTMFCVSNVYIIVTELYKNSKVVSSDFSIMKNIVTLLTCFSILPMKLICCGSFILACLLKSIAISLQFSL